MKVYGYMYQEPNFSVVPDKAIDFSSVREAKAVFSNFCEDMFRYSGNECYLTLYIGESTGDEKSFGYPDYPAFVFSGHEGKGQYSGWPVIKKEYI